MDTVVCMALTQGDEIFILYHKKHNLWSAPLGKVEEGETPEEALRREMKEELGITINDVVKMGEEELVCLIPKPTLVNTVILDVMSYSGNIENKEPHKHSDLHFEKFDNFIDMEVTEATKLLLSHVARKYRFT